MDRYLPRKWKQKEKQGLWSCYESGIQAKSIETRQRRTIYNAKSKDDAIVTTVRVLNNTETICIKQTSGDARRNQWKPTSNRRLQHIYIIKNKSSGQKTSVRL